MNKINLYESSVGDKNEDGISILPWKLKNSPLIAGYFNKNNFQESLNSEAEFIIDSVWKNLEAKIINNNKLFNGDLARLTLLEISLKRDRVNLKLELTNYKQYVGSRDKLFKPFIHQVYNNAPADPLGVSVVIETGDNKIIIGKRKYNEANSGLWYIPGGFINPESDVVNSTIDLNKVIIRETFEELGQVTIDSLISLGISYDCKMPHPEIHFFGKVKEDSHTVLKKAKRGNEFSNWFAFNSEANLVSKMLFDKKGKPLSAAGRAAIILYGNYHFGKSWLKENCNCLKGSIL